MITQEQISEIKASISTGGSEAKAVEALASALYDMIPTANDEYIKNAITASKFKVPKVKPTGFSNSLSFVAEVTQLTRLALMFRMTEVAPYTYEHVDGYWKHGEFSSRKYELPAEEYERNTLSGELSAQHRKVLAQEIVRNAVKDKSMKLDTYSFKAMMNRLYPYKQNSNTCGDRYGHNNSAEKPGKYIKLILDQYGVSEFEQNIKTPELFGAIALLQDIVGGQKQSLIDADMANVFGCYRQTIVVDFKRLNDCYTGLDAQFSEVASPELRSALKSFEDNFIYNRGGLLSNLESIVSNVEAAKEEKVLLGSVSIRMSEGEFCNPFSGELIEHFKPESVLFNQVDDYVGGKIRVLNAPHDSGQADALQDRVFGLSEVMNQVAELDHVIGELKEQKLPLNGYVGQYNDANDMVNEAFELASNVALEIEHATLCQIKASGKFGPVNLAEAFMAASRPVVSKAEATADVDAEENVAPQLGQGETTLEQLIALMNNDLRCNGWDGNLPANDKFPNPTILVMYPKHPFNWLSKAYDEGLSLEAAGLNIRQDIMHRQRCVKMMSEYLMKAKPLVSAKFQAEINVSVTLMQKQLMPTLNELAEAYPMEAVEAAPVRRHTLS